MTADLVLALTAFIGSSLALVCFFGWMGASSRADRLERRNAHLVSVVAALRQRRYGAAKPARSIPRRANDNLAGRKDLH